MTIHNLTIDGITTPLDDEQDTIIQLGDEWIIGIDHLMLALDSWGSAGTTTAPRGVLYLDSDSPEIVIAFVAADTPTKVTLETILADVISGFDHPLFHLDTLPLPWSIEVAS